MSKVIGTLIAGLLPWVVMFAGVYFFATSPTQSLTDTLLLLILLSITFSVNWIGIISGDNKTEEHPS